MTQIEGFAVKHSNSAATRDVVDMEPSGEPGVRWEFVVLKSSVCMCASKVE